LIHGSLYLKVTNLCGGVIMMTPLLVKNKNLSKEKQVSQGSLGTLESLMIMLYIECS